MHKVKKASRRFSTQGEVGKWGPANTDGISIFQSVEVSMTKCRIASGDDNIVLKAGAKNIFGEDLLLLRGKGLSIGSLGETTDGDTVLDIHFRNIQVVHSRHAVRVKMWRGSKCALRHALFENFKVNSVAVGILIDTNYCPLTQRPEGCPANSEADMNLRIKNVTIRDFDGTCLGRREETMFQHGVFPGTCMYQTVCKGCPFMVPENFAVIPLKAKYTWYHTSTTTTSTTTTTWFSKWVKQAKEKAGTTTIPILPGGLARDKKTGKLK